LHELGIKDVRFLPAAASLLRSAAICTRVLTERPFAHAVFQQLQSAAAIARRSGVWLTDAPFWVPDEAGALYPPPPAPPGSDPAWAAPFALNLTNCRHWFAFQQPISAPAQPSASLNSAATPRDPQPSRQLHHSRPQPQPQPPPQPQQQLQQQQQQQQQ